MEKTQLDKTFDQYLDKLIEKKGLSSAPEDEKERFKDRMKEMLISEYNKEVLRRLPEDKFEQFNNLVDNDAPLAELGAIVEEAGINEGEVLEFVLNTFTDQFLNDNNNMKAEA